MEEATERGQNQGTGNVGLSRRSRGYQEGGVLLIVICPLKIAGRSALEQVHYLSPHPRARQSLDFSSSNPGVTTGYGRPGLTERGKLTDAV